MADETPKAPQPADHPYTAHMQKAARHLREAAALVDQAAQSDRDLAADILGRMNDQLTLSSASIDAAAKAIR